MGKTISIDFSQVDDSGALPEGDYPIRVVEVQAKDASDGQSVYLQWDLQVTDGEHAGRNLIMRTSLKSTALFRVKSVFRALDINVDGSIHFQLDETNHVIEPDLMDRVGVAIVIHEVYQGVTRNVVNDIKHIDSLDEKPSNPMLPKTASSPLISKNSTGGGLKIR
jgi:hypothetical protein